jgi:hypothetical protein
MFYKVVLILLRIIMPYGVFRTVKDKIDYSIKIMSQDQVLKVFWKFVRLPLRLIFHLFIKY